jgi:hypothetical protein
LTRRRPRFLYATYLLFVIFLGLLSRSRRPPGPRLFNVYGGDVLWATAAFLAIGFLFPALATRRAALYAILFSFSIELSQLCHAPWIDALRHTRPGALVLGQGFLWSDLACYLAGVLLGVFLESLGPRPFTPPRGR